MKVKITVTTFLKRFDIVSRTARAPQGFRAMGVAVAIGGR
jgi:hypothetical protein